MSKQDFLQNSEEIIQFFTESDENSLTYKPISYHIKITEGLMEFLLTLPMSKVNRHWKLLTEIIIIILEKHTGQYHQSWYESISQIMMSADHNADYITQYEENGYVRANREQFREVFIFKNSQGVLDCLNHHHQRLLVSYRWIYRQIPPFMITSEIMDLAIEHPGDVLSLPLLFIDWNLAYLTVTRMLNIILSKRRYCTWYQDIFIELPMIFKTRDVCDQAYEHDNFMVLFMPEEYVTYQMVIDLCTPSPEGAHKGRCVSKHGDDWGVYNSLERIPVRHRTLDVCTNYVRYISGINIEYVPSEYLSQGLCDLAYAQNPNSYSYIPAKYRSYEMSLKAAQGVDVTIGRIGLYKKVPLIHLLADDKFWKQYHERNIDFYKCFKYWRCDCIACSQETRHQIQVFSGFPGYSRAWRTPEKLFMFLTSIFAPSSLEPTGRTDTLTSYLTAFPIDVTLGDYF